MSQSDDLRSHLLSHLELDEFEHPTAVTLTMKVKASGQTCDPIRASRNFRHFMNRLNRRVFGNASRRYGKKLRVFPVLEANASGRLHYHIAIDRPERLNTTAFEIMIREEWAQTDFGYHEVDVQPVVDDGWMSYLCKSRQKPEGLLDSIDWNNCTSTLG